MRMTRRRRKDQRSIEAKKRSLQTAVMGGMIAMMAAPAYAVPANDALPSGGQFMGSSAGSILASNGVMNVDQVGNHAAIKWDSFNVGANATVNFSHDGGSMAGAYQVLNFSTNGGLPSEIFGRMKAGAEADVWLVNPNGVLIGKGAQIDVGYMHLATHNMSNNDLENAAAGNLFKEDGTLLGTHTPAEVMSMGNLYVNQITFDGDRVVIDFDKLHTFSGKRVQLGEEGYLDAAGNAHKTKAGADADSSDYVSGVYIGTGKSSMSGAGSGYRLVNNTSEFALKADTGMSKYLGTATTDSEGDIVYSKNYLEVGNHAKELVAGYTVYDKNVTATHSTPDNPLYGSYENSGKWRGIYANLANNHTGAERVGFAWVEDSTQLERIGEGEKTLARDYALKDGIAAVNTREMNYDKDTNSYKGFKPIGYDSHGSTASVAPFTGKFDGLGYDIYGLTINRPDENDVGLFGYTKDATIRNVSLVSGSIVGNEGVGGIVSHAENTYIENVRNSARVLGVNNVGGIAGYMSSGVDNEGNPTEGSVIDGGYNVALIRGNQDVGGIVGKMDNGSKIIGDTYNTGAVRGIVNYKIAYSGKDKDGNAIKYNGATADQLTQAVYDIDNKNKEGSLITGYTTIGKNIYGSTVAQTDINKNAIGQNAPKDYYITKVDMSKFSFQNADGTDKTFTEAELKDVQGLLTSGDGFKPGSKFTYNGNTYVVSDMANDALTVQAADGKGGVIDGAYNVSINKTPYTVGIKADGTVSTLPTDTIVASYDSFKYYFYIVDNGVTRRLMGGGSADIGGIAGSIADSTIGNADNGSFTIYNGADIRGGNTVGGIVGSSVNSDMQNLRNEGNILAVGYKMSDDYLYSDRDARSVRNSGSINISNVGGIVGEASGSKITTVLNEGNVTTDTDIRRQVAITEIKKNKQPPYGIDLTKTIDTEYYVGGNVGGIAGTITGTSIADATNAENKIFGAHNVGGIVGMMSNSHVSDSINDGGRIIGTGAVKGDAVVGTVVPFRMENTFDNVVTENITVAGGQENDMYIIGNVGGIAGYMYDHPTNSTVANGIHSTIKDVRNRGDVSAQELLDAENTNILYDVNMGINIGGVVGKALQGRAQHQATVSALKDISNATGLSADEKKRQMLTALEGTDTYNGAIISGAANTGRVTGIRSVGGVAGQAMYATLANSYNMGNIGASAAITSGDGGTSSDIGGVVGDATGADGAEKNDQDLGMYIYNVYNSGVIGDNTYHLYGRHMAGIAGIFTGNLEASYNTGDIYNASDNTGGLVGYMIAGNLNNSFNAGNITVSTRPGATTQTGVGGIVGVANSGVINNVYNLGVLRSFNNGHADSVVGGILSRKYQGTVTVSNAYSTGELGAYVWHNPSGTGRPVKTDDDGNPIYDDDGNPVYDYKNFGYRKIRSNEGAVFAIGPDGTEITHSYLIRPADAPTITSNPANDYANSAYNSPTGLVTAVIAYNDRYDNSKYGGFGFTTTTERVEDPSEILGTTIQDELKTMRDSGMSESDIANSLALRGVYWDSTAQKYFGVKTTTHYTDTKMKAGDDKLPWRMYQYDDVTGTTLYRDAQGNYNDVDGNLVYAHDNAEGLKHVRVTLPTLNAVLPGGYMYYKPYDASAPEGQKGHEDILYTQIGNEYNPVTSFVQLRDGKDTLNLDFLGLADVSTPGARDGIVVNNGNLNITNVVSDQFFSGVYGASGSVNVQAASSALNIASDAAIYGKDVTLKNTTGDINLLGNIWAYDGDVTLKGKNVDVFGSILSGSKYYSNPAATETAPPLTWPDGTPLIIKGTGSDAGKYFAQIENTGRTVDHGDDYQSVAVTVTINRDDYGSDAAYNAAYNAAYKEALDAAIKNPNQAIHNKSYMYQKSLEVTGYRYDSDGNIIKGEDGNPIVTPGDIIISTDLDYTKDQTARPNVNDGKINLSFGNGGTGRVRTDGNLTLVARDVEVDSDISVGLTRTGSVFKIIADNAIFDVSNIGSFGSSDGVHQSKEEAQAAKIRLLQFMAHFTDTAASTLHNRLEFEAVDGGKADAKLALNMYGGYKRNDNGTYTQLGDNELNLKKYNLNEDDTYKGADGQVHSYVDLFESISDGIKADSETALFEFLPKLNVYNGGSKADKATKNRVAQDYSYTNIKNAEQLKNIQTYMTKNKSSAPMHLNWLLRNNIDASDIEDFHTIGNDIKEKVVNADGTTVEYDAEFTGKFNGNGYDLNSLTVHNTTGNVGLFTTIGETGIVNQLNINASRLEGNGTRIGLIAGTNKGIIDTINTFGNTIKDNDYASTTDQDRKNPHFIGGLVGMNYGIKDQYTGKSTFGFINNVLVEDIVYSENTSGLADVGGIAGLNAGAIYQSTGKSDASVADGGATSLGGITGVNAGVMSNVYATGVTNGLYDRTMTTTKDYVGALNVGGIAGENRTVYATKGGVINTSDIVYTSKDQFGDVVYDPVTKQPASTIGGGFIRDAYNDSKVTGWNNVGGVIGNNFGKEIDVTNGVGATGTTQTAGVAYYISNAGDVTGGGNVGGLVGVNNGILKGDADLNLAGVRTEQVNAAGNKIYGQLMTGAPGIGNIDLDAKTLTSTQKTAIVERYGALLGITSNSTDAQIVGAMQNVLKQLFYERQITGTAAENAEAQVLYGRNTGKIEGIRGMKNDDGAYSTGTNVGGLIGISQEKGDVHFLLNGKASSVYGFQNVGGIIGKNEGVLQESKNMMEDNEISGIIHVGGIVGENAPGGVIYGVKNENKFNITVNDDYFDIEKDEFKKIDGTNTAPSDKITVDGVEYDSPKYFGGVLGHNAAALYKDGVKKKEAGIVADAENYANVSVSGAEYVGGIIGRNEGTLGEKKQYIILSGDHKGELTTTKPAADSKIEYYEVKGQYINYGAVGADLTPLKDIPNPNPSDTTWVATNPTVTNYTPANNDNVIATTTTSINVNPDNGEVTVTDINKNAAGQDVSKVVTRYVPGSSKYVGGIIGRNDSDLKDVDLVNHATGFVMGKDYVGGIIGGNVGNITGARDAGNEGKGNYYEDLVYNNGAIVATGQYAGGIAGQNTGNITLAYNTGTVMSTGTSTSFNAATSGVGNYVGGIVGQNNGGTIQEVFSSLSANDFIKGDRYVGGIAGENKSAVINGVNKTGTLKNTYSIGSVTGAQNATQVGNLVGSNSGNVTYSYSTAETGHLIGSGDKGGMGTYTFSEADTTAYGSTGSNGYLDDTKRKYGENYKYIENGTEHTFAELKSADGNNIWKFYDGHTTPILKNFLTNVYYTGDPDKLNYIYNGNEQGVLVKAIDTTGDGKYDKIAVYDKSKYVENGNNDILGYIYSVDQKGTHADADFLSTFDGKLETDLIIGNQKAVDAGEYTMFSSQQIKTNINDKYNNTLGVNNLGYNFVTLKNERDIKPEDPPLTTPPTINNEEITFNVDKAVLTVTANNVERIYGSTEITNGGYTYDVKGFVGDEKDKLISGITLGSKDSAKELASDTAIHGTGITGDRVTQDAGGEYHWTGSATINDKKLLKNYTFEDASGNEVDTLNDIKGNSIVNKAKLTIDMNHFNVLYGDQYDNNENTVVKDANGNFDHRTTTSTQDAEKVITVNKDSKLVNGDNVLKDIISMNTVNNSAFTDRTYTDENGNTVTVKGTDDVKNGYGMTANTVKLDGSTTATAVNGYKIDSKNYEITINAGTVDVVSKPVVTLDPKDPGFTPPDPDKPNTWPKDPEGNPIPPFVPDKNDPNKPDPDHPFDPNDPGTWNPAFFDKDKIYVFGDDVERTYGNATINPNGNVHDYGITIKGEGAAWDKPINEVITLNEVTKPNDGAIAGTSGNRVTNDVDKYTWNGTINVDDTSAITDPTAKPNYNIVTNGGNGTVSADSIVNKKKLDVYLNDFTILYGDERNENTLNHLNTVNKGTDGKFESRTDVTLGQAENTFYNSADKNTVLSNDDVVNGDKLSDVINIAIKNGGFTERTKEDGTEVQGSLNAGEKGDLTGTNNKVNNNYEVNIIKGTVDVVSKPVVVIDPNDPDTWPKDPNDPDKPIPPFDPDPDAPGYDPDDPGTWQPDPDGPFDPNDPDTWNEDVFDPDKIYVFGKDVERTYGNKTINPKDPSTNPKDHDYGVTVKGNGASWDKPVDQLIGIKKDTITDGGLDTTGKQQGAVTNNVGDYYTWNGAINVTDPKNNYTIVPNGKGDRVTAGSIVNKAQLIINLENYKVLYGDIKSDDLKTITGSGNDFKRDGDTIGNIENKNWQKPENVKGVANGDKIENILTMTTGTNAFVDRTVNSTVVKGTDKPGTDYTHNVGDNNLNNATDDNGRTTGVSADGNYDVVINHGNVEVLAKPVVPVDPTNPDTFPRDPETGDPIKPYPPGYNPDGTPTDPTNPNTPGNFDPNNPPPGFDPKDPGTWNPDIFDKDPDRIYVFGNTVNRTYGNTDIKKTDDNPKGEYDVIVKGNGAAWDPDINDLINLSDPVKDIVKTDGAIQPDGEHTNNATVGKAPYHWNSGITVGATSDNGYSIITNGGESGKVQGNSTVYRANLIIKLDDYKVLYGDVKGDDPHTIVIAPVTGKPVRTDKTVSQVENNWQKTTTTANGDKIGDILTMDTTTDAFINRGTDENPIWGTNNVDDGYGHTVGSSNMTGVSTSGNLTTGVSDNGNYNITIEHGSVDVVTRPVTPINPNDPNTWPKDPNGNVIPPFTPDPNAPGYNPNDPGTWQPDPNKPYNPNKPETWNPDIFKDRVVVVGDVVERFYGDKTVINKPAGRPDYNINIIGKPSWDNNDDVVVLNPDSDSFLDGALPINPLPGQVTENPGSYEWQSGLTVNPNYQLDNDMVIADSIVHPRPLIEDHHHEANNGDQRHWRERKAETNFTAGGGDFFNDNYADDGISHIFDDILEANMIDIRPDGTVEIAEYDENGNLIADSEHTYDTDGNIVAGVSTTSDEDENEEETEE